MRYVLLLLSLFLVGCGQYRSLETESRDLSRIEDVELALRTPMDQRLGGNGRFLIVLVANATARYTLVAPKATNEQTLGHELAEATADIPGSRPPLVTTSTDYALAVVKVTQSRAFSPNLSLTAPIGKVLEKLHLDKAKTAVFVSPTIPSETSGLRRLQYKEEGTIYAVDNTGAVAQTNVTLTPTETARAILYLLGFALFPWIGPTIAGLTARRLKDSYAVYLALALTLGTLSFLLALFLTATVTSSGVQRIFTAWFGQGTSVAQSIVTGTLFCIFLAIYGEVYWLKRPIRTNGFRQIAWNSAGLRYLLAGFFTASCVGTILMAPTGTTSIMIVPWILLGRFTIFLHKTVPVDAEIEQRLRTIAEKMQVESPKAVVITGSEIDDQIISAINQNEITFTRRTVEELNSSEFEFLAAHEFAHLRQWKQSRERKLLTLLYGAAVGFGCLWFFSLSYLAIAIVFAVGIPSVIFISRRQLRGNRQNELKMDADALRTTQDPAAAISVLEKMKHPSPKQAKGSSHPTLEDRLANVRRVADELGLA